MDVDPIHLPAKFALPVRGRDNRPANERDYVLIATDCVALERDGNIESHEINEFSGVAIRVEKGRSGVAAVSINLHHDNPNLCVPLHNAFDMGWVGERCQSWARALGLPLPLPCDDETWRDPFTRPSKVMTGPSWECGPRLSLKDRRSVTAYLRNVGSLQGMRIFRGQEIIARR